MNIFIAITQSGTPRPFRQGKKLGLATCVLLAVLAAPPALAFIQPCHFATFTSVGPFHPVPTENLVIDVLVSGAAYANSEQVAMSKLTHAGDGSIHFSVVLTDDPAPFPDFQSGSSGAIGPLSVGDHVVLRTISSYSKATGVLTPVAYCGLGIETAVPFTVFATSGLFPVVEYFNAELNHYFMTQSEDDIRAMDAGAFAGWVRTGQSFLAYAPGEGNLVGPVQRFYGSPSAGLDTHFFTNELGELFVLLAGPLAQSWTQESTDAFEVYSANSEATCTADSTPVYRLWNGRSDANHRYTISRSVRADMIVAGWIPEGYGTDGIVFCAPISRN